MLLPSNHIFFDSHESCSVLSENTISVLQETVTEENSTSNLTMTAVIHAINFQLFNFNSIFSKSKILNARFTFF